MGRTSDNLEKSQEERRILTNNSEKQLDNHQETKVENTEIPPMLPPRPKIIDE